MDTEFNDLDAFSSFLECIHYLPVYGLTFREAQNVLFFWPQLGYFLKMICQACRSGIMDYIAAALKNVYDRRDEIKHGLRITYQAPIMRHFTIEMEPVR